MRITIEDISGRDEPEIIEGVEEFVLMTNRENDLACHVSGGDVFLGYAAFKLSLVAAKRRRRED